VGTPVHSVLCLCYLPRDNLRNSKLLARQTPNQIAKDSCRLEFGFVYLLILWIHEDWLGAAEYWKQAEWTLQKSLRSVSSHN